MYDLYELYMRATTVLLELYLAYLRLHWAGAEAALGRSQTASATKEEESSRGAGGMSLRRRLSYSLPLVPLIKGA
jgi:hypothetical protein